MIAGHIILADHDALWALITACADLLDDEDALFALGEHATDSCLAPLTSFPRTRWQQGRVFGRTGEVHWRTYQTIVRVAVLVDEQAAPQSAPPEGQSASALCERLRQQGFQAMQQLALVAEEEEPYLWRGAYTRATVRHYRDEQGVAQFVRYCRVTGDQANPATAEG